MDVPSGPTVLLVEDDESSREALSDVLRESGFRVIPAADGARALALIGQIDFDVVVSDFHLPDMVGTDLLEQIRALEVLPGTAAVIVSGAEPLRGEFAYLTKPCELDVLIRTLWDRAAVGRHHRLRARIH